MDGTDPASPAAAWLPACFLGALYAAFAASLIYARAELPERVATHFDGLGQADGWMARPSHLAFTAALGIGMPLFVVALGWALRFLPVGLVNIPNRDYWLAPARRARTYAYLCRHALWFACVAVAFVMGINFLVIQANRQAPPHLSTPFTIALGTSFVAAVIVWVLALLVHFARRR